MVRFLLLINVYYSDTDWYRSLVGTFEEREKVLLDENSDLRQGLVNVQRELMAVLTTNATHASSDEVRTVETLIAYLILLC